MTGVVVYGASRLSDPRWALRRLAGWAHVDCAVLRGAHEVPRRRGVRARDPAPSRAAEGEGSLKATRRPLTNAKVERIPASGIRRFFDLVSGVEGVISLGVGEPDFVTPERFREAAIRSIKEGRTKYT